ncbi:MAG: DUF507 family protein [Acidobacteria bacterium]|nr:DUF507 family protein [Acidobacteriota bacterium]
MLLPAPFVHWIARELTRRLGASGALELKTPAVAVQAFEEILNDALRVEEEINAEARALLNQYTDFMRQNGITYTEMFRKVKRNILAERKITPVAGREGDTKISREKLLELSHEIAGRLPRLQGVRVAKGWNAVRLEIGRELTNILAMEQKIDERARQTIQKQKREIVEGGEEWQVLHRRYYEQEMARIGVDLRAPETPEHR